MLNVCMHACLRAYAPERAVPAAAPRAQLARGWRRGPSVKYRGTVRIICEQVRHV